MTTSMMQQTRAQFYFLLVHIECRGKSIAYLKTADETIGDVILEKMSSLVVYARPTPHILVVVLSFALVEDGCSNGPHDDADNEETNRENSIVRGDLLCSAVALPAVGDHNDNGHEQRDAGNGEEKNLGPDLGVVGPRRKIISLWEVLCGVEDGECCCNHGKDDQTASKVDAPKEDLG